MKYTREARLEIGRKVYYGEITKYQAAELYDISDQTARDYMRFFRDSNNLPPRRSKTSEIQMLYAEIKDNVLENIDSYESMSKEELIKELMKARTIIEKLKGEIN